MPDAVRSDPAIGNISVNTALETLQIQIINPTPTGSRPAVFSNQIWRRDTGSTGVWTLAGTVPTNGLFVDNFLRSAMQYDYFIRTDSGADSVTYTGTTPTVTGMWAYASNDATTLAHYPYTDGTAESLDEAEQVMQFVGRTYPVVEGGIQETQLLSVNVTIPFSDTDWRRQVEWWRARKRDRQTILYRDGRGRMLPVRINGALSIGPTRTGAAITCSLQRVDYVAQTTTLDPAYYQAGAYNDGGNGIYGNGLQGNGY